MTAAAIILVAPAAGVVLGALLRVLDVVLEGR